MKYKRIHPYLLLLLIFFLPINTFAHGGQTDYRGGHTNHATGDYHYHHGYPAHDHSNGVCPYDYDDQTDHSSGSSDSGNSLDSSAIDSALEKDQGTENPVVTGPYYHGYSSHCHYDGVCPYGDEMPTGGWTGSKETESDGTTTASLPSLKADKEDDIDNFFTALGVSFFLFGLVAEFISFLCEKITGIEPHGLACSFIGFLLTFSIIIIILYCT